MLPTGKHIKNKVPNLAFSLLFRQIVIITDYITAWPIVDDKPWPDSIQFLLNFLQWNLWGYSERLLVKHIKNVITSEIKKLDEASFFSKYKNTNLNQNASLSDFQNHNCFIWQFRHGDSRLAVTTALWEGTHYWAVLHLTLSKGQNLSFMSQ